MILEGAVPSLEVPVAVIGIAEKGYLSVELAAEGRGGHTAAPPVHTSVGVLSRAIARLETHPLPARLDGPMLAFFREVGPSMSFAQRMAFANLWLFRPLVLRTLDRVPTTRAAVRTTTAATIFRGGEKDNVLPERATAVVNFRLLPGVTTEAVLEHIRRTIDDPEVDVRVLPGGSEPSPVASTTSAAYRLLAESIRQVSPERELLVAPYLVIGMTDARHYSPVADDVYRFVGARITAAELTGFHGRDERIPVAEYGRAVQLYHRMLRSLEALAQ